MGVLNCSPMTLVNNYYTSGQQPIRGQAIQQETNEKPVLLSIQSAV